MHMSRTAVAVLCTVVIAAGCGASKSVTQNSKAKQASQSVATSTQPSPHTTEGHIVGKITAHVSQQGGWTLSGIDFLTLRHGYAVAQQCIPGATDCTGAFGTTSDGGQTFSWSSLGQGAPQSVQFTDPQHGWVLLGGQGHTQRLFGTTDSGRTWSLLEKGENFFGGLSFLSDTVGYAIVPEKGFAGPMSAAALLRTEDGGRAWKSVGTDGYYPASFDFLDARVGYIAGWRCSTGRGPFGSCEGAILGTADGGGSWHVLQKIGTTSTGNVGTFALDFLSPTVGFASLPNLAGNTMGGGLSALEETTNGGQTWHQLQPAYQWGPDIQVGWPSAPLFASPEVGWIALFPGAGPGAGGVLVTTDGGRTFHQFGAADYLAGPFDAVGSIAYALVSPKAYNSAASALVAIRTNGTVRQLYPSPTPATGLASGGGPTLFGWGLPSNPSALLVSRDAGQHWSVVGGVPGQIPNLLSFVSPQQGYAVSNTASGSLQGYRTADGGSSWKTVGPAFQGAPVYVRLFSRDDLIAVLNERTVMRSTNGGTKWSASGPMPPGLVWAVSFATPQRGLAYVGEGASSALYATSDGGRHWHLLMRVPVKTRTQSPGQRMALDANGFGLVQRYSGSGQYLVTHDGGRTWRAFNLPQLANAQALTVSGRDLATIITTTGIYRSQNGGRTWESIPFVQL